MHTPGYEASQPPVVPPPLTGMMAVSLGCAVNVGNGVCMAVAGCVVAAVPVREWVAVKAGGCIELRVFVVETRGVSVFFALYAGMLVIVAVGEAVAPASRATMEEAVALTDDTTCVRSKANARGAARLLWEASERPR